MEWIRQLLEARGVETGLYASQPGRPNLVARLRGRGEAPPLLLQGHVDVVTAADQVWAHPPFGGELVDGWVWGRGALDMKGGIAIMLAALLRCLESGSPPAGDVLLCCLVDEESGGAHGAEFLVARHPELFAGVRHALGEGGGVSLHLGGRAFYPIMVAEKRACRLRARVRGPSGHASRIHRGGTMARLGAMLLALDRARLPVHLVPVTVEYVRSMAAALSGALAERLCALLDPDRTDWALNQLGPDAGRFESLLRHTVNATVVRAGHKVNVIPSEAVVDLDGRILPGRPPEEFVAEVRQVIGKEAELELLSLGPAMPEPELGGFYELLCQVLRELEPGGVPVPTLMTGATDQRHFARLGIQGYGYLPMRLPPGFGQETVHAADERVPVAALEFGAEALFRVLQRYRG